MILGKGKNTYLQTNAFNTDSRIPRHKLGLIERAEHLHDQIARVTIFLLVPGCAVLGCACLHWIGLVSDGGWGGEVGAVVGCDAVEVAW